MTTTDTRDPLDLLTGSRPTDDGLAEAWTTTRSSAALDVVLRRAAGDDVRAGRTPALAPRPRRRRWAALGAAAALAAVAAFGATAVLAPDSSLPRAAAIERLAATARAASPLEIPAGRFLHTVTSSQQAPTGPDQAGHTPRAHGSAEAWTDAAGSTWVVDTGVAEGKPYRNVSRFDAPRADVGTIPSSPRGLRTWPTTGATLEPWLRARISSGPGSDEGPRVQDDMVFETLKDQLWLTYTPPGVRAAAVEVIAGLPGTTVSSGAGRTSLRYAWQGTNHGLVETLVFDDRTSRVVEQQSTSAGMTYSARTTTAELVDTLPRELRGVRAE
jgi:hypothetical protein